MNENSTHSELLIRYIDGELEDTEKAAVEKQIASDAALRQELDGLLLSLDAIRQYGLQQQVKAVRAAMRQERQPAPVMRMNRRPLLSSLRIAASVLVLLGATFIYQYSRLSNVHLYNDNYTPFVLHESRSAGTPVTPLQKAYKDNRPETVLQLFKQLSAPAAEDYFLAGNAYLQQRQPAEAIRCFLLQQQQNEGQHTHLFEDDADYYLALGYLRLNETGRALSLFEKMHANPAHLYHEKASGWFLRKLQWLKAKNN
ncbi:MAG TPA: hypothetical protein VLD19_14160 [Chitinophagaceae bacterium]|nr:hypothetical protein [Chitinophagaceae bacterium]